MLSLSSLLLQPIKIQKIIILIPARESVMKDVMGYQSKCRHGDQQINGPVGYTERVKQELNCEKRYVLTWAFTRRQSPVR